MTVTSFQLTSYSGCTLHGPGVFTVAAGGTAELLNVTLTGGLTFRNEGTTTQPTCTTDPITVNANSIFENAATFIAGGCPASTSFHGKGDVVNDAGATWTGQNGERLDVRFTNNGTMVSTGAQRVYLPRLRNLVDGTLTGGTYTNDGHGGWFEVTHPIVKNAAHLILDDAAELTGADENDGLKGLRTNAGTIEIHTQLSFGALLNTGNLVATAGARVDVPDLTMGATSALQVGVADGAPAGLLHSSGTAKVGGALSIATAPGFDPAAGTTYQIVTGDHGVNGTFSSFDGALADGDHYQLVYTSNAVSARVVHPGSPTLSVTSVAPGQLAAGTPDTLLTIHGTGFVRDASVEFGTPYLTAKSPYVIDDSTMSVHVASAPNAVVGTYDVRVRNPNDDVGTCSQCLQVTS